MSDKRFSIRPGKHSDVEAVRKLAVSVVLASRSSCRPLIQDSVILEARARNLGDLEVVFGLREGGLFVAVDDEDTVIGQVIVMANQLDTVTEVPQAWVYDVSVATSWWGHGVGRELMATAEAFAVSLGVEWIGLGVTASNERAVGFYRELGYEVERFQMIKKLEV